MVIIIRVCPLAHGMLAYFTQNVQIPLNLEMLVLFPVLNRNNSHFH